MGTALSDAPPCPPPPSSLRAGSTSRSDGVRGEGALEQAPRDRTAAASNTGASDVMKTWVSSARENVTENRFQPFTRQASTTRLSGGGLRAQAASVSSA